MAHFTPTGSLIPKRLPTAAESAPFETAKSALSEEASLTKEGLAAMFAAELPSLNPANPPLEQPNPNPQSEAGSQPKAGRSSFLYRQYAIFGCSKLTVYIQGVLPNSALDLSTCQPYLKVRQIGAKLPNHEDQQHLAQAAADSLKLAEHNGFYNSDYRTAHLGIVNHLIQAGIAIDPARVLSKSNASTVIEKYLTDLAEFLTEAGYSDPDEWLADRQPATGVSTGITFDQAVSLADW